jgi:hypothetical protein
MGHVEAFVSLWFIRALLHTAAGDVKPWHFLEQGRGNLQLKVSVSDIRLLSNWYSAHFLRGSSGRDVKLTTIYVSSGFQGLTPLSIDILRGQIYNFIL